MRNLPFWFWLVPVIGAWLVLYRLIARRHSQGGTSLFKSSGYRGIVVRTDPLVNALLGDAQKAQRLADYEKQRNPKLTIAQARERALERLGEDRWR